MSDSIVSTVESTISGLVTPLGGITSVIDDGEKVVTEVVKEIEQQFTAHNTPAMVTNKENQDEQKEIDEDRAAVEQAQSTGNLDIVRERNS